MNDSYAIETIQFKSNLRTQSERRRERSENLKKKYPIRAARLLALAHDIQSRIEMGEFNGYAEVARLHLLTRARLTQIMNLLYLAPDIQEEILHMEAPVGKQPVTPRKLRVVSRHLDWNEQRKQWNEMVGAIR